MSSTSTAWKRRSRALLSEQAGAADCLRERFKGARWLRHPTGLVVPASALEPIAAASPSEVPEWQLRFPPPMIEFAKHRPGYEFWWSKIPGSRLAVNVRGQPGHRTTTAHLQAAYPFVAEGGLGGRGVYIGRDVYGGSFCYDPWELYGKELTSPSAAVIGIVGRAKSSLVKT